MIDHTLAQTQYSADAPWGLLLLAIAVAVVPGIIINFAAGLRWRLAVIGAVPVHAGVVAVLSYLFFHLGIRTTRTTLVVGMALVAVTLFYSRMGWRRWKAWRHQRTATIETPGGEPDPTAEAGSSATALSTLHASHPRTLWRMRLIRLAQNALIPLIGIVTGTYLMLVRSVDAITGTSDGLANVYQGWDVHWHASVIRYIADTGIAASTEMGPLQNFETQTTLFYPTAWHTVAFEFMQLTGVAPVVALNVMSFVLPTVTLSLSAAGLTVAVVLGGISRHRRWRLTTRLTASIAAGLAPVIAAGVMPLYWIGYYVGFWPYLVGTTMIGCVVLLFMGVPTRPNAIIPAGLALAGAAMMHPAVVTVIVLMVLMWWLFQLVWSPEHGGGLPRSKQRPWRARMVDLVRIAVAGIFGLVLVVPQIIVGLGMTEEVDSFTDEQNVDRMTAWRTVLELQTRHAVDHGTDWWLLWIALAGAVLLLLWRRAAWVVIAQVVFIVIAVHSVKNFDGIVGTFAGIIGGLHYNTTHRLVMIVALLDVVFVAAALAALCVALAGVVFADARLARTGRQPRGRHTTVHTGTSEGWFAHATCLVASVLMAVTMWKVVDSTQTPRAGSFEWSIASARNDRLIDDDERRAYAWLAQQPHAFEGTVANNADEGSGWMYPLQGLVALNRHFLQSKVPADSAQNILFWHPNILGGGLGPGQENHANAADFAAKKLGVRFYVTSPPPMWADQELIDAQITGLWSAKGVTPVYLRGNTAIFAINAQFTDRELRAMRTDASRHGSEQLPALGAQPGAQRDSSVSGSVGNGGGAFHRPSVWDEASAQEQYHRHFRG